MQGRERSSLPALPAAEGGWLGILGRKIPVSRDALYQWIAVASKSYFNGGETGARRTGASARWQPTSGHPWNGDERLAALCPPVPGKAFRLESVLHTWMELAEFTEKVYATRVWPLSQVKTRVRSKGWRDRSKSKSSLRNLRATAVIATGPGMPSLFFS